MTLAVPPACLRRLLPPAGSGGAQGSSEATQLSREGYKRSTALAPSWSPWGFWSGSLFEENSYQ